MRDNHLRSIVYTWLSYFERLAPAEDTDNKLEDRLFFVGDRLTWVDYVIFELLDTHVEFGKLDFGGNAQPVDILGNYPRLKAFYDKFSSRPRIAAYLKAAKRYPFRP